MTKSSEAEQKRDEAPTMNLLQMERIWANVLSRNTLVREREMPDSVATSRATFAFHAYGSSVVRLSINVESTGLRAVFQFLLSEGSTQEKQSAVPQNESSTCTVPRDSQCRNASSAIQDRGKRMYASNCRLHVGCVLFFVSKKVVIRR